MSTKSPNTEAYITKAHVVSLDVCWANSTTGFFGAHTCKRECVRTMLTERDARDSKRLLP